MMSITSPRAKDVFITQELYLRTPGKVDSVKEKMALQSLAALMADNPQEVLPKFVSLAMEMCEGISSGLSLYEEHPAPGVFRWHHLQGTLAQFVGAATPRNNSPCGIVLDLDTPVLTAHSERGYDWLAEHNVSLPEVLLVPLHIGGKKPMGTLWIVSDEDGHFHREHVRVTTELASFVAIALRMLSTEQRLRFAASIVESSDDAIVSKNLDGVVTSWNRGAERIFGYAAEEAIGRPITIVIPHDRHDEERAILTRIRRGERIEHFETVRQRKHGSLIFVSLTVSPVKNAEGKIVGASKIVRDITE